MGQLALHAPLAEECCSHQYTHGDDRWIVMLKRSFCGNQKENYTRICEEQHTFGAVRDVARARDIL